MEKRKNKNWYEVPLEKKHIETPKGVSMTVPDETYTVRELYSKFTTGMRVADTLQRVPVFSEDADFDSPDYEKVRDMDLADRHELQELEKEREKELEKSLTKKREQKQKIQSEKQIEETKDAPAGRPTPPSTSDDPNEAKRNDKGAA